MSDSLSPNKWAAVAQAIAITSALAIISGYSPLSLPIVNQIQASFLNPLHPPQH